MLQQLKSFIISNKSIEVVYFLWMCSLLTFPQNLVYLIVFVLYLTGENQGLHLDIQYMDQSNYIHKWKQLPGPGELS
jgi:hypothetical protein